MKTKKRQMIWQNLKIAILKIFLAKLLEILSKKQHLKIVKISKIVFVKPILSLASFVISLFLKKLKIIMTYAY